MRLFIKKPLTKLDVRFAAIPHHLNFSYETVFNPFAEVYFSVTKIGMAFFSRSVILTVCYFLFLDGRARKRYYCCVYRKYIPNNFFHQLYPHHILCSNWFLGLCNMVFCKNYFLYKKDEAGR